MMCGNLVHTGFGVSYASFRELERNLNPNDRKFLNHLLRSEEETPDAFVEAVWRFATAKGGDLRPDWHREGICTKNAFEALYNRLRDPRDRESLNKLHSNNFNRGEPELCAICDFAIAKGRESDTQWRKERNADAAAAREGDVADEITPARKRPSATFRGRYEGVVSLVRDVGLSTTAVTRQLRRDLLERLTTRPRRTPKGGPWELI